VYQPLRGRSMSMIFQKRSTRTRVSAEAGMADLGGHALFWCVFINLSWSLTVLVRLRFGAGEQDIQLGKNETLRDTATVLGRFNDVVLARVFGHADVLELAAYSGATPVINALSDMHHPLQGFADLSDAGRALWCWWARRAAPRVGGRRQRRPAHAPVLCGHHGLPALCPPVPRGYEPDAAVLAASRKAAAAAGTRIEMHTDPRAAVAGADVIVTDTWCVPWGGPLGWGRFTGFEPPPTCAQGVDGHGGGQGRTHERLRWIPGSEALHRREGGAAPGWVFLHCLPRKPEEVDDAVFYSPLARLPGGREPQVDHRGAAGASWTGVDLPAKGV